MGVGRGERVAIVSPNSARFVVALFGVERVRPRAGAGQLPPERRRGRLHRRALGGARRPDRPRAGRGPGRCGPSTGSARRRPGRGADGRRRRRPESWDPDEDAVGTINYTSGTTARPKGVALTPPHADAARDEHRLAPGGGRRGTCTSTRCRCSTPTGGGCRTPSRGWAALQVVLRRVDGAEVLRRVAAHGVTLACGAPAVADAVVGAAGAADDVPGRGRMRMFVGGAAPPSSTVRAVRGAARLGVHARLRPDGDRPAAGAQPPPAGGRRPGARGGRPPDGPPGAPGDRRAPAG